MDEVRIRPATQIDLEILCNLYHEYHEYHVRGLPDRLESLGQYCDESDQLNLHKTISELINAENTLILLAEVGSQVVGTVEVYLLADKPSPGKKSFLHGFIQSFIVRDRYRRHGIGKKLMAAAHQWAKEKGAREMRLDTWEFSAGPLAFYERHGYRTMRRTLVRDL